MPTFLLTWNPLKWHWDDLQESVEKTEHTGYFYRTWSCGNSKQIREGDRIFLIRLGKEPKGIMASGYAESHWFEKRHWDNVRAENGAMALYVDVGFNIILNPDEQPILSRESLNDGILSKVQWSSQSSGIRIPDDVAEVLEEAWKKVIPQYSFRDVQFPEEVKEPSRFYEGTVKKVSVNTFERNAKARHKCLEHYGFTCMICGFNFEDVYGDIGKEFIHVHHVKPLSEIGAKYEIDPIQDLCPICPNCHAMIHRENPSLTIDQLRKRLKRKEPT